jgi:sulfur-carrier protein adenylyltransferase/sulfurtransferase
VPLFGFVLQRQVIHGTSSVGTPKILSTKARILEINPNVQVGSYPFPLSSKNALEVLEPYDGTDNFPTRYLVNDACVPLGKPNVYGSIFRFEGQASVFWAERGPCYRCVYPDPPPPGLVPSCAEGGVLGILPGTVGTSQATETLKLLLGIGEPLIGRLLLYNALNMRFRELRLNKDPECPICGANPPVTHLIDYEQFCGINSQTERGETDHDIVPTKLKARLDASDELRQIYGGKGITPDRDVVAYCRIGERSAHTWFVLTQLLGYPSVSNYDGSWTEWGNLVGAPIEKGDGQ